MLPPEHKSMFIVIFIVSIVILVYFHTPSEDVLSASPEQRESALDDATWLSESIFSPTEGAAPPGCSVRRASALESIDVALKEYSDTTHAACVDAEDCDVATRNAQSKLAMKVAQIKSCDIGFTESECKTTSVCDWK